MSDLISMDVLIRDITEKIDFSKAERAAAIKHGRYNDVYFYSGEICIARRIRRYVNMFAPTVDAEPVVHARWVHGITLNNEWRKCSKCLVSQDICGCFTYCPNCGAKMDGGAE